MRTMLSVWLLVILWSPLSAAGPAAQPNADPQDLKTLSLEELIQIEVTTVSRSPERRIDTPAAVSVITGEDIRRYGVDTLADALRLADSVSVSRFNGGSWAIATRGFSAITNNKMLVMIDGRSVLLHDRHAEFAGGGSVSKYFQLEVAVRITWQSR